MQEMSKNLKKLKVLGQLSRIQNPLCLPVQWKWTQVKFLKTGFKLPDSALQQEEPKAAAHGAHGWVEISPPNSDPSDKTLLMMLRLHFPAFTFFFVRLSDAE